MKRHISKFCIVGALLLLCSCKPGKSSDDQNEATILKVMTYNIHHANPPSRAQEGTIDLEAIAGVIKKVKPDLVALQEVDVNNARSGVDLNEARALAESTGMHYHFSKAISYRGGAYGDAVLSRYPIIDSLTYHLPIADSSSNAEIRTLSMIKVSLPDNKEIYFASTHLDQYKDETNRLLQAHKIVDIVNEISLPVIIGGDFNATPDSKTIRFLDGTFTRSCTTDCPLTIPVVNPVRTIDYIMYRPADMFQVREVKTVPESYASDHLPVSADIELTRQ